MSLKALRKAEKGEDRFERRFAIKRTRLPKDVCAAIDVLMAEVDVVSREYQIVCEQLAEARALADRDALTPTLNRRAFIEELGRVASYVERYKTEAALLFIDMNGFKALNDSFGHSVGDAALQHTARVILQHVRESDVVGRIGGDEFAVVLANVSRAEAVRKAAQLAEAIASTPIEVEGVRHVLSASIGQHHFSGESTPVERAEALLARADEAMYAAKHARRLQTAV